MENIKKWLTYVTENFVVWFLYVELLPDSNCLFLQLELGQSTGTHRSAEPVSTSTVNLCAGVPNSSGP